MHCVSVSERRTSEHYEVHERNKEIYDEKLAARARACLLPPYNVSTSPPCCSLILRNSIPWSIHNGIFRAGGYVYHFAKAIPTYFTCLQVLIFRYFHRPQIRLLHLHCLSRARTHKYLWYFIQILLFFFAFAVASLRLLLLR